MKIKHYIYIRCKTPNKNRILMKFYKNHIPVYNVISNKNFLYLKVDQEDYDRIKKTIVTAKFYYLDEAGFFRLKKRMTPLNIFSILLFLFLVSFFSRIIVKVDVIHSNREIRDLVTKAIAEEGIHSWTTKKDYNDLQEIKNKILANYKDKLEWLEIENTGMHYIVRIEERILNNTQEENKYCHVVASKSGIINSIQSKKGEVLVYHGQYVQEGDILITGEISYNEEIKNNVCAEGEVIAETWYQTSVHLPINYIKRSRTGKKRFNFALGTDTGNYKIFRSRLKNYETEEKVLFHFFDFTIYRLDEYEVWEENLLYDEMEGEEKALILADEKMKWKLGDPQVNYRKVLKNSKNDSTMDIEIFYSVLESIGKTEEYFIETEEEGS